MNLELRVSISTGLVKTLSNQRLDLLFLSISIVDKEIEWNLLRYQIDFLLDQNEVRVSKVEFRSKLKVSTDECLSWDSWIWMITR